MESQRSIAGEDHSGAGTIRTRRLLTRASSSEIVSNATLRFEGGVISSVARDDASRDAYPDTMIIPALANAHDHGRGLKTIAYGAFDTAVEAWVPATYTLPKLDPYAVAALAFARMACAGMTSIVHCHLSADPPTLLAAAGAVSRAARDVGVRVGFVVPLRDRHRLGYGDDDAILAHMDTADIEAIKARWLGPIAPIDSQLNAVEAIAERCSSPFFTVQYGPVGMEWCSDTLLAEVAKRAEASQRRVHMHMLESRYQLAHGTWLRPDESSVLADHGVTVSVNTSSNLRLKSGIAQVQAMKAAKLKFAIGLDALALDDDDDILRELRLAHLLHAGLGFDHRVTREDIFHAGSAIGACAVCGDTGAGRIDAGTPADFIVLNYKALSADISRTLDDPFTTFFTRARREHIAAVFAAGRPIVQDGRVLGIDQASLQRALAQQVDEAAGDIAALQPLLKRFQEGLTRFYQASDHSSRS